MNSMHRFVQSKVLSLCGNVVLPFVQTFVDAQMNETILYKIHVYL